MNMLGFGGVNIYDAVKYWNERKVLGTWGITEIHLAQLDFIRKCLVGKNVRILDFGIGAGRLFEAYCNNATYVEGYDISSLHSPHTIKNSEKFDFEFKLTIEKEIKTLPYKDNCFDYVVSAEVLLHQSHEHIISIMKELARVGRRVIIISWYEADRCFDDPLAGKSGFTYGNKPHCFHYDYFNICIKNGLDVIASEIYEKQLFLVYSKMGGR